MSLASMLLNGGTLGAANVDASRYGHNSASRIAMESTEELHEIFLESFYNVEQAELAAATEGVALEGSQYEPVAEAAIKNAATKIKEFLQKLWGKVKAFFASVRRYLDAIFMSGADFVKKYQKDIDKMGRLEDYTFNMYKYDDAAIDTVNIVDPDEKANEILKEFKIVDPTNVADNVVAMVKAENELNPERAANVYGAEADATEKMYSSEECKKLAVIEISGGKCKDPEDFEKWCFGVFRGGAESAQDKEDIDIKSVDSYVNILKSSSKLMKNVNDASSKMDKAYSNAIKVIGDCEKALDKVKDNKAAVALSRSMRAYSSSVSTVQSTWNTYFNAWKSVVKERDTVYKQVIMGGFSNAKKTAKADK